MPKPDVFTKSSRVGLVMPASAPADSDSLRQGMDALRARGLQVCDPVPSYTPVEYLAGTDEERAQHFNQWLTRTDISTLISIRGGFGVMRILDQIDYETARKHPKILIGYSDITALQLALYTLAGWRSIAGPMVAVEWPDLDSDSETQFWDLCGGNTLRSLSLPGDPPMRVLQEGKAEGILLGGNLAAVVRLLGTRYLPNFEGVILFLEDIGEAPYRVDAMLAQLKLAGILDQLAGVALGSFSDCDAAPGKASFTTDEVLTQYFSGASYPVVTGLNFGHQKRKVSMPFGVRAQLSATGTSATLSMLEPVVNV